MKYIVDRTENNFAVCEAEDMSVINIPLEDLPVDIKEGSVILHEKGKYILLKDEETERKQKILQLQNDIFSD